MKKVLFILLALATMQVYAQDLPHYKRVVKALSSAKYQGRGYAHNGANKAGKYLQKEFTKAGAIRARSAIPTPGTSPIRTWSISSSAALTRAAGN